MITSMSNMILAKLFGSRGSARAAGCISVALLSACSAPGTAETAGQERDQLEQPDKSAGERLDERTNGPVLGQTGVPAPPLASDEPLATETSVISKVELAVAFKRPEKIGCYITFAYRGFQPDVVISNSPCSELDVGFVDQTTLKSQDDWDRLDSFQQANVNNMPDGKVLYVGGEFAAAIYPIGLTGTSEEIWISD
jgi:hypothetical protein